MFAALKQVSGNASEFETKKALLVINTQNDSLYRQGDFYITKNPEYVEAIHDLVPYFRRVGDVIWVRTEMGVLPTKPSPDAERIEQDSVRTGEENKKSQIQKEANIQSDSQQHADLSRQEDRREEAAGRKGPMQTYDPSSRIKRLMTHAPADAQAARRSSNMQTLDGDDGDSMEDRLIKPRKGQQSKFFVAGTNGAEIADRLQDLVLADDMIVTKHFYSAFDQTSLLTELRMQLITEVYLCGGLTNASIYSTAADAVQHGMDVTVIEDCLGWRSRERHDEAMQQMLDIMGVSHMTSDDFIEESGGRVIPDAVTPGITLNELSIGMGVTEAQAKLMRPEGTYKDAVHGGKRDADVPLQSIEIAGDLSPSSTTPTKAMAEVRAQMSDHGGARQYRQMSLGPTDKIASGDSSIIHNFLDDTIASKSFEWLKREVQWQTMDHRGGQVPRLVAVQGSIGKDGSVPIYRHPADESPPLLAFSPTVFKIKKRLESILQHTFNHVLIQLYRNGEDNISEHADKTLDIVQGSKILNVSLGAQRVMTMRTKKVRSAAVPPSMAGRNSPNSTPRNAQRIPMPHNSVFILGPQSNREWLHGVRADKRPGGEKREEEKAFNGERISLTFRHIGTFLNEDAKRIWGTGATSRTKDKAKRISTDQNAYEKMIIAFGKENHDPETNWEDCYGGGFDCINLATKASRAKLTLSSDKIANLRVQLCLGEAGVEYEIVDRSALRQSSNSGSLNEKPWIHGLANTEAPVLMGLRTAGGEDAGRAIEGDLAILIALERRMRSEQHNYTTPQLYKCIAQSNELLYLWYELTHTMTVNAEKDISSNLTSSTQQPSKKTGRTRSGTSGPTHRFELENRDRPPSPTAALRLELTDVLMGWEKWFRDNQQQPFLAGDFISVIDVAFWPVFKGILDDESCRLDRKTIPKLLAYHERVISKVIVHNLIRSE